MLTIWGVYSVDENIDLLDTNAGAKEKICAEAEILLIQARDNIFQQSDAISIICQNFIELKDPASADLFFKYVSKKFKISKKIFTDTFKKLSDESKKPKFDRGATFIEDEDDPSHREGWFVRNNCYWFHTKEGMPIQGSNFIIKPLYHIYSKIDNKRLVEITNEHGHTKIIDIPSKNFISVEQFQAYVYNEGNFIWKGSKAQYMKILQFISNDFPLCKELHTLGWRKEGFYAFANGIYNGVWQPVNYFGITAHKEKNYFSPAFSVVYSDVTDEDDEYQNDRYFVYNQAPCSFAQWSALMMEVYASNAVIGIAFAIATVFRDLIYEKYKCFPHLFLFGEVQSGKSQLAWSLSNLFFHNQPPFNLISGTHVGLSRKAARAKNCMVWCDEYSNDIDPRRFQLLKAAFDGVGHEKGKMTQDTRTKTDQINGSFCISGQFLPIIDDNALLTRSCLLNFSKRPFSKHEMEKFDELKKLEEKGISSLICDILDYRKIMEEKFAVTFSQIHDTLKAEMLSENLPFNERLLRNYCILLAPVKIILGSENPLSLSFTYETIYAAAKHDICQMSKQITSGESISGFWRTVEFLIDKGDVKPGVDFIIKDVLSLKFTDKNGDEQSKKFEPPNNKLLFIRFSTVHPLYLEKHRQQTGRNGVDLISILHYLKNHKSYVGTTNSVRFDTTSTSGYVFKYGPDELNANLDRTVKDEFAPSNTEVEKEVPPPVPKQDTKLFEISPDPPF